MTWQKGAKCDIRHFSANGGLYGVGLASQSFPLYGVCFFDPYPSPTPMKYYGDWAACLYFGYFDIKTPFCRFISMARLLGADSAKFHIMRGAIQDNSHVFHGANLMRFLAIWLAEMLSVSAEYSAVFILYCDADDTFRQVPPSRRVCSG